MFWDSAPLGPGQLARHRRPSPLPAIFYRQALGFQYFGRSKARWGSRKLLILGILWHSICVFLLQIKIRPAVSDGVT